MSKNRKQNTGQNTSDKTFQANLLKKEVPLKNIHQIKYNYSQISL